MTGDSLAAAIVHARAAFHNALSALEAAQVEAHAAQTAVRDAVAAHDLASRRLYQACYEYTEWRAETRQVLP